MCVTQKRLTFANELRRYAAQTVFNDNSTRLAYRKICRRVILFYNGMANKKSRSIEEQIELLKQRGMIVGDEAFAARHLAHISYYRLKGYWWDMQYDKTRHLFQPDSNLEDVVTRYYFDKELRLILFDAIETIEITLRTKMIYHLSQSYGGLWYRDPKLFADAAFHAQHLKELMEEFLRSNEIFVKDYKRKHLVTNTEGERILDEYPDAWIIFEVATFGTLSKIYKNLNHQLPEKSAIANDMGLNLHSELSGWLEAISYMRNIIAHHSRVWSRNMVKRPCEIRNPRMAWLSRPLTEVQQKKPFYVITAMLYLCNAIDEGHTFKEKLLALFKEKSKNGAGYELYSKRWLEYAKNGWKKENDLVLKIGFDSSGLYDIGQEKGYGATQNMWMKGVSQSMFEARV